MSKNLEGWPEPAKLESSVPIADALNLALLPKVLQPLVRDVAERMSVPPDMPAAAAIACLGASVNRRARIQPLKDDSSWKVVPCIWSAVVALPGQLKSPTLASVCAPLERIQSVWREQYDAEMLTYSAAAEEYRLKKQAHDEMFKAHYKDPHKPKPRSPGEPPLKPVCRRLIVNDATHAKLHELFSENAPGLFLQLDELTSWLASLDKPGYEDARSFFLTCWSVSGDAVFTLDRIGRGTVTAKVCLSLLGGIQPDALKSYLGGLSNSDGLLQRLQVLVWPEATPYKPVDRQPNEAALEKVEHAFQKLLSIDVEQALLFRFAPTAQHAFNTWRNELEAKVRDGDLHSALAAHLSKYRSLMPALALLFELIDRKKSSTDFYVSLEHTQQAIAFCAYLESHARKVYHLLTSQQADAAYSLSKRIQKGALGTTFKLRDVYRRAWSDLTTKEQARRACDALVEANWLRSRSDWSSGTNESVIYDVSPKVLAKVKEVKS